MGFRVLEGFRLLRVQGFRIKGLGFRALCLRFRVWVLGFRFEGLGCRFCGSVKDLFLNIAMEQVPLIVA